MDTQRFGNIMRATAVELAAIADAERRMNSAEQAWETAELQLQTAKLEIAAMAEVMEQMRLQIVQAERKAAAYRQAAQEALQRAQRMEACTVEMLAALSTEPRWQAMLNGDRMLRMLAANAYEAAGESVSAMSVAASRVRRLNADARL